MESQLLFVGFALFKKRKEANPLLALLEERHCKTQGLIAANPTICPSTSLWETLHLPFSWLLDWGIYIKLVKNKCVSVLGFCISVSSAWHFHSTAPYPGTWYEPSKAAPQQMLPQCGLTIHLEIWFSSAAGQLCTGRVCAPRFWRAVSALSVTKHSLLRFTNVDSARHRGPPTDGGTP